MSPSPCTHCKACVNTRVTYYLLTTVPWGPGPGVGLFNDLAIVTSIFL